MLAILSPSKTMASDVKPAHRYTLPVFEKEYQELYKLVSGFSVSRLQKVMKTSPKLSEETKKLYEIFPSEMRPEVAKTAILTFRGDVYQGLNADSWSTSDLEFAQDHLRVLSGLYGVLKPLDLMAPYRLEMGLPLKVKKYNNLYRYWGEKIAKNLADELSGHQNKILLNLASGEYFKSVVTKNFPYPIFHVEFKEYKNGKLSTNSITSKKMRGVMMNYIVQKRLDDPASLLGFGEEGFLYAPEHSNEKELLFVR